MVKPGYDDLTPEEKAEYAKFLLSQGRLKNPSPRQTFLSTGWPDSWWMLIPGLFGLPVERESRFIKNPLLIFGFLGLFLMGYYFSTHMGIEAVANRFGFVPHLWYRNGFATFVTSFFIHNGLMHLIGNSYYLYVFGDDVEDDLELFRFLILLFGSHISGLLAQAWFDGGGDLPIIGASAGVSGIMGYYLIRFPKRQISYMFLLFVVVYWVHLPVFMALLVKFAWEFVMAKTAEGQVDGVAHFAHFSGALFGAAFAWLSGKKKD